MDVKYAFVPEYKSTEIKHKSDILSHAGRLLELVGSKTLIVGVNMDDEPFILQCPGRLTDAMDFELSTD